MREELGGAPCEIFDDFQREPIASASLAQVHRATWRGAQVAVKVQHRGLAATSAGASHQQSQAAGPKALSSTRLKRPVPEGRMPTLDRHLSMSWGS